MDPRPADDLIWGWMSSSNTRGTIDILYSCLSTIYLCTWTSMCLNFPHPHERGWRFILYKFRWQIVAIFFPEVVVATAAEQWLSAYQSVRSFAVLDLDNRYKWTVSHGFFADMGGIWVTAPDSAPFAVDSHQLAFLVTKKYLAMPHITTADIRATNKADGFARAVTLVQIAWFCLSCVARSAEHIGLSPLEVTTLAFIVCTLHNYIFWYLKPLDPQTPILLHMDASMTQVRRSVGVNDSYSREPLDFINLPPDPKSLITPFWFGVGVIFNFEDKGGSKPTQTFANSRVRPSAGVSWSMMLYLLFFQVMYYGLHLAAGWTLAFPSTVEWYLWTLSNLADLGLITVYCLALALGTYFTPFIGRFVFRKRASSVLELASMLPHWARLLVHGPFVLAYIVARAVVLTESIISLRALPAATYQDVTWSTFLPHI